MWLCFFFFFKQKTAYEMRISDWSSDVCSSDLQAQRLAGKTFGARGKSGKGLARHPAHMRIGGLPARQAVVGQRGVLGQRYDTPWHADPVVHPDVLVGQEIGRANV